MARNSRKPDKTTNLPRLTLTLHMQVVTVDINDCSGDETKSMWPTRTVANDYCMPANWSSQLLLFGRSNKFNASQIAICNIPHFQSWLDEIIDAKQINDKQEWTVTEVASMLLQKWCSTRQKVAAKTSNGWYSEKLNPHIQCATVAITLHKNSSSSAQLSCYNILANKQLKLYLKNNSTKHTCICNDRKDKDHKKYRATSRSVQDE